MVERLGIAITTYNRRNQVVGLSAAIRLLASTPIDLVICDDGSSDNTVKTLLSVGETVIGGRNGGIARNKNRGIWYLLNRTKADAILLLDDDVLPVIHGWEQEWLSAVEHYGHVNFSYPSYRHCVVSGSATAADPALATMICSLLLPRPIPAPAPPGDQLDPMVLNVLMTVLMSGIRTVTIHNITPKFQEGSVQ